MNEEKKMTFKLATVAEGPELTLEVGDVLYSHEGSFHIMRGSTPLYLFEEGKRVPPIECELGLLAIRNIINPGTGICKHLSRGFCEFERAPHPEAGTAEGLSAFRITKIRSTEEISRMAARFKAERKRGDRITRPLSNIAGRNHAIG